MQNVKLALVGFGNVGQAFASLLSKKRESLTSNYDLYLQVTGILTGKHGGVLDAGGIDLDKAISLIDSGESLSSLAGSFSGGDAVEFIKASSAHVMLENTPVDYSSGQPAIRHIEAALESGMHAVTANKGPVVYAYDQLTRLAAEHNRSFFFESAVMDGAPVFSLWRNSLPCANLISFRGVLNSTTNLILTLMERGDTFNQAVQHAQEIGIAETDPSGDTEGWDAAIKVAALATVLMDHPLLPGEVERQGITKISKEQVNQAVKQNQRWKLVCAAQRTSQGVEAYVRPQLIGPQDPLFNVMGTSSAITFHSDVLGALTLYEQDPGPHTTAYGLLADLLNAINVPAS